MATLLEFLLALYPGLQNYNFGIWNELRDLGELGTENYRALIYI